MIRFPWNRHQRERSDRQCWASLIAVSLVLSPTWGAEGEDQPQPSGVIAETRPAESEPVPAAVVEPASETPARTDVAPVDEEIESRAADDTDRAEESEPPRTEPAAEIFVPSEDISEDFAVPFPVDI